MQSFRAHQGPVFALCMDGRQRVLSSGADPLVVQFELTSDRQDCDDGKKWVMTTTRSKHTHDVRALLSTGQHIVSAGSVLSQFYHTMFTSMLSMDFPFIVCLP